MSKLKAALDKHNQPIRRALGLLRAFDALVGRKPRAQSCRMACHEQAESASNGYRAWIRTMNNASKGRIFAFISYCVSTCYKVEIFCCCICCCSALPFSFNNESSWYLQTALGESSFSLHRSLSYVVS